MQVRTTDSKAQWHADQQVHANAEGAAQTSGFFPPFRLQLAAPHGTGSWPTIFFGFRAEIVFWLQGVACSLKKLPTIAEILYQ